jgi:RNA recognition motif-containing protein
LGELFGKYGKIKSIYLKEDSSNPDRKFAFVCFEDPQNREAGFDAAERAVQELNKLYVQPALSAIQRQGVILREQQRFKNSKKKCNLFVKNFPATFREEDLRPYFA